MSSGNNSDSPSRAVLVTVSGVRALKGWTYDNIFCRVDGGDLLNKGLAWVWNFAADANGDMRELRFWRFELERPEKTGYLELEWVIARILPEKRKNFHAGEVVEMFTLTRPTLMKLRPQMGGQLAANSSFFSRDGLARFLRERWLGACYDRRQGAGAKSSSRLTDSRGAIAPTDTGRRPAANTLP